MSTSSTNPAAKIRKILLFAAPILIIALGMMMASSLANRRKPPARAEVTERALRVAAQTVELIDAPVMIEGYGEARTRDEVIISPEVSGRVVAVHPQLEVGGVIPAGETMFSIDPRDYETRVVEAEATAKQWESTVARTEKQYQLDKSRLDTYRRMADLAKKEYDRMVALYEKENITSESAVSDKEMAFKQSQDALDQVVQTVDLYPNRIEEARSALAAAQAALDQARINLERTSVVAPFTARVKETSVEPGQWVMPGTQAVTIADDSLLEISVALNSTDARQWLLFKEKQTTEGRAWFNEVKRVPVQIAWTEALENNQWQGTLDRVERFNDETRTVTVIVRVEGNEASAPKAGRLPLVEGMFCRVRIPGRVAEDVVRLAAEVVGFDQDATGMQTVYVAHKEPDSGRTTLRTRQVRTSHNDGDYVYIAEGLKAGELVITTRLVNPLENSLVEVIEEMTAPKAAEGVPAGR